MFVMHRFLVRARACFITQYLTPAALCEFVPKMFSLATAVNVVIP